MARLTKNTAAVRGTGVSRHNGGPTTLKSLNTIECCDGPKVSGDVLNLAHLIGGEKRQSLGQLCACCFSSPGKTVYICFGPRTITATFVSPFFCLAFFFILSRFFWSFLSHFFSGHFFCLAFFSFLIYFFLSCIFISSLLCILYFSSFCVTFFFI